MPNDQTNPNYQIFEDELIHHPLIKDKIQEKINKKKFSTPIPISKEKHTVEQTTKAAEYDNLATLFPNHKIPSDFKDQWEALNKRPNITQEEYNQIKAKVEKQPTETKPVDYDQIKENLKKWTDAFPKTDPDFNKEPNAIHDDYEKLKAKANQKPIDPASEEKELDIDNDQPESIAKKKLITEIRRVAKLKNISVHFTNDKTKLVSASKTDIYLLLDQKDNSGQFNANLILNDFAKELNKAELGSNAIDLNYYKQFIKEQLWLKDSLIADYQPEYNKIINPSTIPTDKLNISQLLAIFYPETLSGEYTKNDCMANSQIVDKTWQTIRDKALELVSGASGDKEKLGIKIDIAYNNPDYAIILTYHQNSSVSQDLEKLIISTPLLLEIERLKREKGNLPNPENFEKAKKQNQLWEESLHYLTDKKNYTRVKEKIDKI